MSYTEKSDARDYPRKWFFSLGGRIAVEIARVFPIDVAKAWPADWKDQVTETAPGEKVSGQ